MTCVIVAIASSAPAAQSKNLFSNIEKQRLKTKPSLLPGLFCAQKALDAECNDSNIEKKAS